MSHLWVVEMRFGDKWFPTVEVAFSRMEGREELEGWREQNPLDDFRLVKYVREKP
jgi:hypothetical protein